MLPQIMPLPWSLVFFLLCISLFIFFVYFNYLFFHNNLSKKMKVLSNQDILPW